MKLYYTHYLLKVVEGYFGSVLGISVRTSSVSNYLVPSLSKIFIENDLQWVIHNHPLDERLRCHSRNGDET